MKKRILSLVLSLVMVFSLIPSGFFIASAASEGYYTYEVSDGEAKITSVNTSINGYVVVPSYLGGYPVTEIGDYAFWGCSLISGIVIPKSVVSIGNMNPFTYCPSLESITVEEGNEYYYSDGNCIIERENKKITSGCKTSVIPQGVEMIGMDAFRGSSISEIEVPEGVTTIGGSAFDSCFSLKSIVIPTTVTIIYGYAFFECSCLENITIPESVTDILDYAFYGCSNLTDVYYGGEILNSLTTIREGNDALLNATWHYSEGEETLGDITEDGEVNITDVQNLFSVIVNGNAEEISTAIGDMDGNDVVNIIDVRLLFIAVANGEI